MLWDTNGLICCYVSRGYPYEELEKFFRNKWSCQKINANQVVPILSYWGPSYSLNTNYFWATLFICVGIQLRLNRESESCYGISLLEKIIYNLEIRQEYYSKLFQNHASTWYNKSTQGIFDSLKVIWLPRKCNFIWIAIYWLLGLRLWKMRCCLVENG